MMMMMPYSGVMYIVRQYRKLMISFLACNFQDDNTDDDDLYNVCCSSVQKPGLYCSVACKHDDDDDTDTTSAGATTSTERISTHISSNDVTTYAAPKTTKKLSCRRENARRSVLFRNVVTRKKSQKVLIYYVTDIHVVFAHFLLTLSFPLF